MAKRIGVLTSGGDSPGMNAAVRAVVRAGVNAGLEVFGINRGFKGLIENDMKLFTINDVGDIIQRGGTKLKTARSPEFMTPQGIYAAIENIKERNIDAIVTIGGDGTLKGAKSLNDRGIVCYHIPATIDNDLGYTDYTIGFDSAVNTVLYAINNIKETGIAHDKTTVIEVMGRDCGDIALRAGLTGGAEYIFIPEVEANLDEMGKIIIDGYKRNKTNNLIIRAEGSAVTMDQIAGKVKETTGEEIRRVDLGYLQRGGTPSALDRMIATLTGVRAVELAINDTGSRAIAYTQGRVEEYEIDEAISIGRNPDLDLLELIKALA